jgi:Transposase DDE domain
MAEREEPPTQRKRKTSSVRHTRAIERDRTKRPATAPPDEQIEQRLGDIIRPATYRQVTYFWDMGLRERTLTLPVMMALVLSMIWRQISAVSEVVRTVHTQSLLWVTPRRLTQQALSQRLNSLPAELFWRVLDSILPGMRQRWAARKRPLPPEVSWAQAHYPQVVICDGSTLDALVRRLGLLRDLATQPLAGRMTALLELGARLPIQVWFEEDAQAHDLAFWPRILSGLQSGALLIFDLGYTNFRHFADLTARQITFLTRAKKNLAYQVERVLHTSASVHDALVWIGPADNRQLMRLIEVLQRGLWYRYLTNELDDQHLPTDIAVALYGQRWRIEDAYAIVKRLLGLAYFWSGSQNAIQLQLWATWILYAVLVDLTDAVAEQLQQPFAAISMEMVYRGLYHFTSVYADGQATDVVLFLAKNAPWLGVRKRKRNPKRPVPTEDALDRFMQTLTCD